MTATHRPSGPSDRSGPSDPGPSDPPGPSGLPGSPGLSGLSAIAAAVSPGADHARLPGRSQLRIGPVSLLIRRRAVLVAAVLTGLLLLAVVLSLSLGTPYVAPADVLRALSGASTPYDLVVLHLRLPRVVLAAVAGAAFGVAGTLIQSVARNPLASPDVIGITQGAGLAATVALTSGMAAVLVAPTALVGGLLAAVLLFALGARHGLAAQRFVLAGVAVAFGFRALTEVVMLTADPIDGLRAQIWLIGTLAGKGWTEAAWIGGTLLVLLPVLAWAGWALNSTALDDDTARGVGCARRPAGSALPAPVCSSPRWSPPRSAPWTSWRWSPRRSPAGWSAPNGHHWSARRCSARCCWCWPIWPAAGCSHPPNCPPVC